MADCTGMRSTPCFHRPLAKAITYIVTEKWPGQHGQRNAGKTDGARGEQCRGYAERILCNQPYRYGDHLVS